MTTNAATTLPAWLVPPRPEGFLAEDLDHLPEAPRRVELWDGALILNMAAQRAWHSRIIRALANALSSAAPVPLDVLTEFSVILDARNRLEPDVLVARDHVDGDRTWVAAEEVLLAVEAVSPESVERDRRLKPQRYAEAGIEHFWRVEEEDGATVVYVYELDPATSTYVATGIHRGSLSAKMPFPVEISL